MAVIFIVDDDDTNLMAAKLALEGRHKTYALVSAKAMLRLAERIKPDLILLDIAMPEVDGFAAITVLKAKPELKAVPVVFLSAATDPQTRRQGRELGAVGFVAKPFSATALVEMIEAHIGPK